MARPPTKNEPASKCSEPARPLVVGHRGASAVRPENTHAAFVEALEQGADGIELDLQSTADESIVVYHDRTLRKVGHGRRRISDVEYDVLRRLDVGSWFHPAYHEERIPTLEEVLERYAHRTLLMLEIKSDGERSGTARWKRLIDGVVDHIERHRVADRVYVLAFDPAVLARVRARAPHLRLVLDIARAPRPRALLQRTIPPLHAVCCPARFVSARATEAMTAANRRTWVYRCDTERNLSRALMSKVEAMITDDPRWLSSSSLFTSRYAG